MKSIVAAAALAVSFAFPAFAALNCASTEDVIALLTQKYGEEVVVRGIDRRGDLILFWSNPESGTWTATVTRGEQSCIVAQGEEFERVVLSPNI